MMFRVRHVTRYEYGSPVDLASHMLHLTPRDLPWHRVHAATLTAEPAPARRTEAVDHFGNGVTWLFLEQRHRAFAVEADLLVEVNYPTPPPADETLPWEDVSRLAREGGADAWQAAEFVFASPMVATDADAGRYAASSLAPGRPILAALLELNTRIRTDFTFRAGATTLTTPVSEVMARRQGVCQDFAHLMISALRANGLPARYCSGYIRTKPPPGQKRRIGSDQSHAWVGCWLGPVHGWIELDPTNGLVVKDEHVLLAWGRDYGDISPVRGVILGGRDHTLTVTVDLEAIEDAEDATSPE